MVRDILDYNGNVIGELELPDDTPEQVWQEQLAKFIIAPPSQTQRYETKLARQKELAPQVMAQIRLYMIENVSSLADASDIYHQLTPELLAVSNGAFEVATYMLSAQIPSGAVTEQFLAFCIETVKNAVVPL